MNKKRRKTEKIRAPKNDFVEKENFKKCKQKTMKNLKNNIVHEWPFDKNKNLKKKLSFSKHEI